MHDGTEEILLALADPINWVWQKNRADRWHWQGETNHTRYTISPPTSPTDVDTPPYQRVWTLHFRSPHGNHKAPTESVEQAKELARHHVLTGDAGPVDALQAAAQARVQALTDAVNAANALLYEPVCVRRTPRLRWEPANLDALTCRATGTRGIYKIQFDPERRWVARFQQGGQITEEHGFVMATTARMACCLHSHTGEWLGML